MNENYNRAPVERRVRRWVFGGYKKDTFSLFPYFWKWDKEDDTIYSVGEIYGVRCIGWLSMSVRIFLVSNAELTGRGPKDEQ